jgi:hypothetical protein
VAVSSRVEACSRYGGLRESDFTDPVRLGDFRC